MRLLLVVFFSCLPAAAETVQIFPDRDATLIEDSQGEKADGSGPSLFCGRTSSSGVRRALLRFDVAAALPRNATIESVSLTLFMQQSHEEPNIYRLYRVREDWSEGPAAGGGGGGAQAGPGDVTWLHTDYDQEFWSVRGGLFAERPSGRAIIEASDFYTWESTRPLVRDVRRFLSHPEYNFGWVLIGNEEQLTTSKKFASRENPDESLRPILEIEYVP